MMPFVTKYRNGTKVTLGLRRFNADGKEWEVTFDRVCATEFEATLLMDALCEYRNAYDEARREQGRARQRAEDKKERRNEARRLRRRKRR